MPLYQQQREAAELQPALGAAAPLLPAPRAAPADPEAPAGQPLPDAEKDSKREMFGLFLNAVATVFGTGMSLFAKVSGGQGITVFEIVLTRSLILVLFTGPELLYHRVNPFADPKRRWLLVLRGVLGFCSVSSLYLAVALLPLADASVLSFLSPIFVALLGPIILNERSSMGVLLGIPVALLGVILVAQPSFVFGSSGGHISALGVLVGVMQACFNALARMCVRALSKGSGERMASIIFGQGAISCVGAAIMCAATKKFRVPTGAQQWAPLLAGGFLGYLYQLALTGSLQRARVAPAVAMSYLSVIWGLLADVLVFHSYPNGLGILGATIICLSSFSVAYAQKKQGPATTTAKPWQISAVHVAEQQKDAVPVAAAGTLQTGAQGLAAAAAPEVAANGAEVEAGEGEDARLLGGGMKQQGGSWARLWEAANADRKALQLAQMPRR